MKAKSSVHRQTTDGRASGDLDRIYDRTKHRSHEIQRQRQHQQQSLMSTNDRTSFVTHTSGSLRFFRAVYRSMGLSLETQTRQPWAPGGVVTGCMTPTAIEQLISVYDSTCMLRRLYDSTRGRQTAGQPSNRPIIFVLWPTKHSEDVACTGIRTPKVFGHHQELQGHRC